jgi:hypothetical protein
MSVSAPWFVEIRNVLPCARIRGAMVRKFLKWLLGALCAIAMAVSIGYAKVGFGKPFSPSDADKVRQAAVLCFWILMPPVYFWFEYYFLYLPGHKKRDEESDLDFDRYKFGADQSAKIWLALITVLFGLYFGKDLVKDSSPAISQSSQSSSNPQNPR